MVGDVDSNEVMNYKDLTEKCLTEIQWDKKLNNNKYHQQILEK